jgi:hypothetical protein
MHIFVLQSNTEVGNLSETPTFGMTHIVVPQASAADQFKTLNITQRQGLTSLFKSDNPSVLQAV